MKAKLVLDDNTIFEGTLFGKKMNIEGELVFNTSMVGYPESLTDPSYKSQILVLTYPSIGNYGIPPHEKDKKSNILKYFESNKIQISGLIIADYCENHSHWNSNQTLSDWMEKSGVPGIYGIDTRQLTKIIREKGSMKASIISDNSKGLVRQSNRDLVSQVSNPIISEYNKNSKFKIIVFDCVENLLI